MYYFIVNPCSNCGRGKQTWQKLKKILEKKKIVYESYVSEQRGDARTVAKMLTRSGMKPEEVIVVVGGSGTLNEVLDGLAFGGTITLGYIPAGSENDFARSLKLPFGLWRGMKRIFMRRSVKLLDYGVLTFGNRAEHRRFAVSAGMGINGAVCHELAASAALQKACRLPLRRLCHMLDGLKQFFLFKPSRGYIILDRVKKIEFNHIYLLSAQIHPFEGGVRLAPGADGSDGKLSVCVMNSDNKWKLFPAFLTALFTRRKIHKGIRVFECREVLFHVDRPMASHTDGEACGIWNELQAECIERKIRMIT